MECMLCGVDLAVQLVAFYIQLYHYFVDSNWTDQDSNWTDQSLCGMRFEMLRVSENERISRALLCNNLCTKLVIVL